MDIITLPIALAAAVGGIIGNNSDRSLLAVMRVLRQRLQSGGLPTNHDLQRAVRKAYLQATRAICQSCTEKLGAGHSWWTRDIGLPRSPEVRWLDKLQRTIKVEMRRFDNSEYVPPASDALQNIELLLQPKGVTAAEAVGELRARLKHSLLDELRVAHGEPPSQFTEMVLNGWGETATADSQVRFDWFDILCAFFAHSIKNEARVRSIFEGQLLAQLAAEGVTVTGEGVRRQLEELGQVTTARLYQIDEQVSRMRSDQAEALSSMRGRLDDLLPALMLLPDIASGQQALSALAQDVLQELRRRPIYERYAGWEVADRVEELIGEYTDVFVGGEKILAKIHQFFTDNSGGVLLVTAKAGFGKTALLANLVKILQDNAATAGAGVRPYVIYHFFSHRFLNTRSPAGGLRNLLRQLYAYYELQDESLPDDETSLRETLYGLLRERGARPREPLVIALDGLDEAERMVPPCFPSPLPEGVFVIASARAEAGEQLDYLRGWTEVATHLHLDRLPRAAIAEWLTEAGGSALQALANDESFVLQLEEKTGGFPLYLRHLIEEMREAARAGQESRIILSRTPRGFQSYVKQQLGLLAKEVRHEREVQRLFALLCVAKGALGSDDLQQLIGLTVWDLQSLPWQVTRWFTIREQDGESLYTFTHPTLRDEFERVLGRQAYEERKRLLDYCARWQEHSSRYALRHTAEHLRESKCWDDLFALARDETFRQAQSETLPEDPDVSMQTAQTALRGATEADDAVRMAEFLLTSARRLMEIRRESPLDALRAGSLAQALEMANLYEIKRSILWHMLLAWELKDENRAEEAEETLKLLLEKSLPRLSDWESYGIYGVQLLFWIYGLSEKTFTSLQQRLLSDEGQRKLCRQFIIEGRLDVALKIARDIKVPREQTGALTDIAEALARASEQEASQAILADAVKIARQISYEPYRVQALKRIAAQQAEAGNDEDTRATSSEADALKEVAAAQSIPLVILAINEKDRALGEQAIAEGRAHNFADAVRTVRKINDRELRLEALKAIAVARSQAGDHVGVIETARSELLDRHRAEIIMEVVRAQSRAGEMKAARATLAAAFQNCSEVAEERFRIEALEEIDPAYKSKRAVSDAQYSRFLSSLYGQQINTSTAPVRRRQKVSFRLTSQPDHSGIARAKAQAGEFAAAINVASEITIGTERGWVLNEIATEQAKAGETEAARITFAAAVEAATTQGTSYVDSYTEDLLEEIAREQIKAGLNDEAVRTAQAIVIKGNEIIPEIADAFVQASDKEHFKQLLIPCTYYIDAAFKMCVLLARLYPERSAEIARVI
jgi:AAA ATPase-like protein